MDNAIVQEINSIVFLTAIKQTFLCTFIAWWLKKINLIECRQKNPQKTKQLKINLGVILIARPNSTEFIYLFIIIIIFVVNVMICWQNYHSSLTYFIYCQKAMRYPQNQLIITDDKIWYCSFFSRNIYNFNYILGLSIFNFKQTY